MSDWIWLEAGETVTLAELSRMSGMSPAELDELVDYGALACAAAPGGAGRMFGAEWVGPLRTANRLRADFDLDLFTVSLLLGYLNRIEQLERQLKALQAQLPKHQQSHRDEGPAPWREPHGRT